MLRAAFRLCVAAHVGSAAEGSADVRGPHLHEVFELEQFAQGPEEVPSTLLGLHGQVGAGEVPDEERVPGEEQPRLLRPARVLDQEAGVLGAVAGSGDGDEAHASHLNYIAVGECLVLIFNARVFGDVEQRTGGLFKTSAAREVVGMVVGLQDVRDSKVVFFSDLKVVLYLPLRVYYRRLAAIGYHVGGATQIFVKYLPKEHGVGSLFSYPFMPQRNDDA